MTVATKAVVIRIDMVLCSRVGKQNSLARLDQRMSAFIPQLSQQWSSQLRVCKFRITGCGNACRAAVLLDLVPTADTIGCGRTAYLFRSRSSCTVRSYESRS
jgi:hypothetical protein